MKAKTLALVAGAAAATFALTAAGAALISATAPAMFVQSFERHASRVLFWDNAAGPQGQFTVAYSAPAWTDKIAGQMDAIAAGQRARLGKDQWATLDTAIDLDLAGVKVKSGYYYLGMERTQDGWSLVLFDHAAIHKQKSDAFLTPQLKGGTVIPLAYEQVEEVADELSIEFIKQEATEVQLEILFGPHKLTGDVKAGIEG